MKFSVVENILIHMDCYPQEIELYTTLFQQFRDIFVWSYQ